MPDRVEIALSWASEEEPDDNLTIAMSTDQGDVCSIMLTSRTEPFEGINESINLQYGATIAKIDDFRRLAVWQDSRLVRRRYWPKDVGHRMAILQPFRQQDLREWREVLASSLLMLEITDMVRSRRRTGNFSFSQALAALDARIIDQSGQHS
jgi:hypothetical protein